MTEEPKGLWSHQAIEADRLTKVYLKFVAKLREENLEAITTTIHDRIEFYCQPDKVEHITNLLKEIMEEK